MRSCRPNTLWLAVAPTVARVEDPPGGAATTERAAAIFFDEAKSLVEKGLAAGAPLPSFGGAGGGVTLRGTSP